ncbi:MAG: dockerin type I repeat-containing protein [Ruminococcus sp.]|nr:dockerin type I repeat-containing protein [Ruminococcus sp.]
MKSNQTINEGNTDIIITGDSSRNKTQVMPGGIAVTQGIELPASWDTLLTSMSYQPLDSFYISKVDNSVKLPSGSAIPSVLIPTSNTATWRIVASDTYVSRQNTMYYNATTSTLYYWDKTDSAKVSVTLDNNSYSDFVAFVQEMGSGSSFTVSASKQSISKINLTFSSNASLPDKNMVAFTKDALGAVVPTIAATTSTNPSRDGSTITMNDTVTTFTADLGGDIVKGDSTDAKFVSISGTTVTINPSVTAGATAVIGASDGNGTYRTMTIVNGGDGTYKLTYNTANTLTLASSAYYLKGTFNNWEATDAFQKTDNDNILVVTKKINAGTYTFKVHDVGTDNWHGNDSIISDVANRLIMNADSNATFKATGGTYEFKYEISTNRLSVYKTQAEITVEPTTKTVYVGVIEYITDFVPTLHYWNNSTGLSGDATLTATGETVQYAVGSSYWNNAKQNFKVYKTEIPVAANGMKTYRQSNNDRWAAEDVTYADDKILLLFEWGGTYHNTTDTYIVVKPTEPPTAPTTPETQPPTEPQILLGDVDKDGSVTVMDATQIQMYLAQLTKFTDEQKKAADTSKDSTVSIMDATLIQMLIAQIIDRF